MEWRWLSEDGSALPFCHNCGTKSKGTPYWLLYRPARAGENASDWNSTKGTNYTPKSLSMGSQRMLRKGTLEN